MTTDEATLYHLHRGYHPRAPLSPSPQARRALPLILAECGDLARASAYLAWVHESEDVYARQLRGATPWHDGTVKARHDLESLSRHLGPRLLDVDAWEARGRTAAPTAEDVEAAARAEREAREDAESEAQAKADNERRIKHYRDNGLPMPAYLRVMQ
jgi:hypothetical protein